MLEIILIGLLAFLILTFFYKQAICEFRINQIEWDKKDTLHEILSERTPTILRGIPKATFWTHEDVMMRTGYGNLPIFNGQGLPEWLTSADVSVSCPWTSDHAASIASISGLKIWADRWLNSIVLGRLTSFWHFPKYGCWSGARGLFKSIAPLTGFLVTEGEITVTIMPENISHALPAVWRGCFPGQLTQYDTPFVGDLKFMDIVLRPGNILFMPAHWFVSWLPAEESKKPPMICSIEYHTPISKFAASLSA
jgi:hypothetical protein